MHKTLIAAAALSSLLIVSPVFADRNNHHGDNDDLNKINPSINRVLAVATIAPEATSSPSATPNPCGRDQEGDEDFRNHGEFVSCVARLHERGEVKFAAQSEVGKHEDQDDNDEDEDNDQDEHHSPAPTVSPTPTSSPSATMSPMPTVSPSASPSATPPISSSVSAPNLFTLDLSGGFSRIFTALSQLFSLLSHQG